MFYKKRFGEIGENKAKKYLQNIGYKIIESNFRTKLGEIDIIAKDKDVTVFIEVKARSSGIWGTPSESITAKKLSSIVKTAQLYLQIHNQSSNIIRVDAVEVYKTDKEYKINHIKNITI